MTVSGTASTLGDSRPSWDSYFLEIASVVAKRSTCPRLKVGAVITLENKIMTTGYNGAPSGEPHCTEVGCIIVDGHCKRTFHAEENALAQLTYGFPLKMYVTHKPCVLCREQAKMYLIHDIIWENPYGNQDDDH
jgi:dCMP deaminase